MMTRQEADWKSRDKRIFPVANSHIDPVWLWDKYEGIDEVINTFCSACDRLDEYPDLKFSASSICFYKWVEQYAPDVFERIIAHVRSGRWEVTGGWWIESDCNLPTARSFYKSAEMSRKFVSDRFEIEVQVGYSPDSFGHAASMPKILSDCGLKYYVFCRPNEIEKPDLPGDLFYWEYEGSRVLCYRLKYYYSSGLTHNPERIDRALSDDALVRSGLGCLFFGVGDHGGGPTKSEIDYMLDVGMKFPDRDVRFSTCLEFFKTAEKIESIPTYRGDLHFHAVGCYSVNRNLKHAVRRAERSIENAERVLCAVGIEASPMLDELWEKTIFNQFHDIMPGSCSPSATQQALAELGGVQDACSELVYGELKHMSRLVPVSRPSGEFRIYNSLSEPVRGPIEMESFFYYSPDAAFKDLDGNVIATQEITPSVTCVNRRWVFVDTIPPMAFKSYCFDPDGQPSVEQGRGHFFQRGSEARGKKFVLRSPGQAHKSDTETSLFASPLRLAVLNDDSDTWSHEVRGYGEASGYFEQEESSVNSGGVASYLLSKQRFAGSTADLLFKTYENLECVDLDIRVFWAQESSILKLEIDPLGGIHSLFAQGPGASIEKRNIGAEEPMHGWILLDGLGLLQDGAFAFDLYDGKLRITLVRSNYYGYDRPFEMDRLGVLNRTDMGEHNFRLRFLFGSELTPSVLDRMFDAFIEPLAIIRENSR